MKITTQFPQGQWKGFYWGGAMWVEKIKMLINTKEAEVFLSKNNCLDKESMPEKAMFYTTGGRVRWWGQIYV